MLDSLTSRLTGIFDRLRGSGRLTEENIQEALREVRVALLEADVNFKVVKAFVERVREKAVGQDVLQSLTPGQQVVKIVHDELVELLGGSAHRLAMAPASADGDHAGGPAGLRQDHQRRQAGASLPEAGPAARSWPPPTSTGPRPSTSSRRLGGAARGAGAWARPSSARSTSARAARDEAAQPAGCHPLILDTAGRLHIDEEMLEELRAIKRDGRARTTSSWWWTP